MMSALRAVNVLDLLLLLYEKKFLWYLKRVDYDMRLCIRCIPVELIPDFKLFLLNHI